ncbi:hypothetical protein QQY24_00970 [Streptomyces sp. TG1A-8]|uniref:hypothetical protein n=1 Tax=Streptomyces sp. TG1A-8 TaxID=3051385 RepID=UPI00265BD2A2|nr:hypothetical protein [Streptomyces sp. TG1A-8]MDO0924075.1 hypothetical protein [Streptomyces sp. TG1A-8]
MLYEFAARADEVLCLKLCLNMEDLYPQGKRRRITAKDGPKRSSRRTPGCWPTRSPRPRTSRTWMGGRSAGYVTVP